MPPAHKQPGNEDLSPTSARNLIEDPELQKRTQPANTLTCNILSMEAVETAWTSDLQNYK